MNTHRVKLYFEDGAIGVRVICPESGCQPVSACSECGRYVDDRELKPCEFCEEHAAPCWLAQWAEASDPSEVLEWMQGEVTIEVNGVFEQDAPLIEVYEPDVSPVLWRAA